MMITTPVAATGGTFAAQKPPHSPIRLTYQGWSGCILETDESVGASLLVFDPAPKALLPAVDMVIPITHGHPEHVQGVVAHVMRTERAPVTVVASRHVCRFLERRSTMPTADRFWAVVPGDQVEPGGWKIRVFGWDHMSLLPPNLFLKLWYLTKLFSHPFRLGRIGLDSAFGPRHAPMLGFHVQPPTADLPLVYYGEGLHRQTTPEQLRVAFGNGPIGALLTAVEPEDTQQLPSLLAPHQIGGILAFEAHRIWREQFGMPQIDLPDLMARFRDLGFATQTPAPGESVTLITKSAP